MAPPIDTKYYMQTGPASSFEHFTKKICSFEDLFNHNKAHMLAANGGADKNECVHFIHNSIKKIAAETGIREALLLCVIIQESTGNCRVKTTYDADGKPTGGLMQCEGVVGAEGLKTMTQNKVDDMIRAGAHHLKGNLTANHGNIYAALRVYNSGSIAPSGDLSDPKSVGTPKYVSDVANRLHGWSN
ncbi:hypothetical protein MMC07_002916 [Pseudocyphellaria aurata]|nr:hypothetical protein [Pseudocyphellaria aurata]